jgi:hypothetical protein
MPLLIISAMWHDRKTRHASAAEERADYALQQSFDTDADIDIDMGVPVGIKIKNRK